MLRALYLTLQIKSVFYFFQGLSLSGLEKQEIQEQAVSLMMSKYPNCSNKYHMCCDTVGAIATSSDKGSLNNSMIITIIRDTDCTLSQNSRKAKKGQQWE